MFWNGENQETKAIKQNQEFETQLNRERNTTAMVDPSDQTYLYQKEQTQDLTRWQQDLDDDVELLRHDLLNERLTEQGWQPAYENAKPLLNNLGVTKVISLIKRYLGKNLIMSNLSSDIINRIMRGMVSDLVISFALNWEKYEMDVSDRTIILRMIKDSIEPTLYRSFNNGERAYLNTINKRIETMNGTQPEQKQGFNIFGAK